MGWFSKLFIMGVLGLGGLYVYDLNREGYFTIPDIPHGAYPISCKNGFRAIVHDMDVADKQYADTPKMFRRLTLANSDRRFISVPADVPPWFEQSWSTCRPGTNEEREYFTSTLPDNIKRDLVGARLDAICYIEIEGEQPLFRGLVYSIPA
jgi:hypothetical protein